MVINEYKIEIDSNAVMYELSKGNFSIGENPYGVMTSIQNYVNSIYDALASIEDSWKSAVNDVGEYIDEFKNIPEPEIDPLLDTDFLDEELPGNLKNVNNFLNVRSGPGSASQVVGTLSADITFSVLGTKKDEDGNEWYLVKYKDKDGNETTGYVSSNYVDLDGDSLIDQDTPIPDGEKPSQGRANENAGHTLPSKKENNETKAIVELQNSNEKLNIRKYASSDSEIIGTLENGKEITVINDDGKSPFIEIKLENGDTAFVSRDFVNVLDKNSNVAKVNIGNNAGLNVRKAPNSNGEIVGTLKNNASVEVIGKENGWTKIKFNNQELYVDTKYLN